MLRENVLDDSTREEEVLYCDICDTEERIRDLSKECNFCFASTSAHPSASSHHPQIHYCQIKSYVTKICEERKSIATVKVHVRPFNPS